MAKQTFKKKGSAKRAAKKAGKSVYKVKGGWRLTRK
jgi:hypothetical protein